MTSHILKLWVQISFYFPKETQQKPAAEQGKTGIKRTEEEVLRADLRRQVPW